MVHACVHAHVCNEEIVTNLNVWKSQSSLETRCQHGHGYMYSRFTVQVNQIKWCIDFCICNWGLFCLQDGKANSTREVLLHNHLIHWATVRKKWHAASHLNEARYNESGRILKAIYKRSVCFIIVTWVRVSPSRYGGKSWQTRVCSHLMLGYPFGTHLKCRKWVADT
jgi:hypothetical protein